MNNQGGFTDLRLNGGSNDVQEGFWPSFTDIMTVIVMIFLIAMVVLLVRNMELVSQLRATMEAERIAAELARATGEEKDTLSSQLHRAEDRVQQLQLEIMRLQDKDLRSETLIAEQLRAISGLTNQRDDLAQQAAQLALLRERLEADIEKRQAQLNAALQDLDQRQLQVNAAQRSIASLEETVEQLRARYSESQQNNERLQQTISEQRESIAKARELSQDVERRYLVLTDDFDELKVKYDKLVRPARSSAGRHLIEVRYWKADGQYRISWREGGDGAFQSISRSQLDKVLSRIGKEHENGLYVKVIFPENSGLSYNEAWEFTSHMHGNYDYYFKSEEDKPEQDKAEAER
jgi:multidrug efflux pump subunit AcrA (membrane-fusion protein)